MKQLFCVAILATTGVAHGAVVTIDFESTLPVYFGLDTYSEDGFTLTSNVPDGTIIDVNNDVRGNLGIFSGGTNSQTIVWGENGTTGTISVANDAGDPFLLQSLDTSSMGNATGQLILSGTYVGGSSYNQVLNITSSLTTYNVASPGALSGLDISFDGGAYFPPFDLDNIVINVIPIPAAVWLFASGLGAIGWFRRRSVKSA
jgi:hypothetical protein